MEKNAKPITNDCSMAGIKPAVLHMPYPPIQAWCRNPGYAAILTNDYCGAVSELSAITQYINNENRLCMENCRLARTLLEIAMAEMMHLQKLGELITLLGGEVDFSAIRPNGAQVQWTPSCLSIPRNARKMLCTDIQAEKDAIAQHKEHMGMISDECVNAGLRRIIRDEEYHIILLKALLEECQN